MSNEEQTEGSLKPSLYICSAVRSQAVDSSVNWFTY